MSKAIVVNKAKFDALLGKMINTDPLPYREVIAKPKLRKDGKPKHSWARKKSHSRPTRIR
jgi:hypothetical protein